MPEPSITIVLATANKDKVREIRPMIEEISPIYRVMTLEEAGVDREIEESEPTLEGNAMLKAATIHEHLSPSHPFLIALADDTGLEVRALDGAPGVYSARFAPVEGGGKPTYADNVRHLLKQMEGIDNRQARFRTVITMQGTIPSAKGKKTITHTAEGIVEGEITTAPEGKNGFGYDPVFRVEGEGKTFAEMESKEKNAIGHRGRALRAAVRFLKKLAEGVHQ